MGHMRVFFTGRAGQQIWRTGAKTSEVPRQAWRSEGNSVVNILGATPRHPELRPSPTLEDRSSHRVSGWHSHRMLWRSQSIGTSLLEGMLLSLSSVLPKWLPTNLGWPGKMFFSCCDKKQNINTVVFALVCNIFVTSKVCCSWVVTLEYIHEKNEPNCFLKCLCSIKFRGPGIPNWTQPSISQE